MKPGHLLNSKLRIAPYPLSLLLVNTLALGFNPCHAQTTEKGVSACTPITTGKSEWLSAATYQQNGRFRINLPSATNGHASRGITDELTGKRYEIPAELAKETPLTFSTQPPKWVSRGAQLDGQFLEVHVYDLSKKTLQTLTLPREASTFEISGDGQTFLAQTPEGIQIIPDLNHPHDMTLLKNIQMANLENQSNLSEDGRWLKLVDPATSHLKVMDLSSSGLKIQELPPAAQESAQFQGNQAAWISNIGNIHVRDLATGKQKDLVPTLKLPPGQTINPFFRPQLLFLENGKKLAVANPNGGVEIYDLKSQQIQKIETPPWDRIRASTDGSHWVIQIKNQIFKLDPASGQLTALELPKTSSASGAAATSTKENLVHVTPDGNAILATTGGADFRSVHFTTVCVPTNFRVIEKDCCSTLASETQPQAQAPWMQELISKQLCQNTRARFSSKDWKAFAPSPRGESMTEDEAGRLLLRFQKLEGLDLPEDIPSLVAILRSQIPEKNPTLMIGALQTLHHLDPELFGALKKLFPKIQGLKATQVPKECRTEAELDLLNNDSKTLYQSLLKKSTPFGDIQTWSDLQIYSPFYNQLPAAKKDEMRDQIADTLANSAAGSIYDGIFISKLYKFAYQATAPWVGEKIKPLTDISLVRYPNGSMTPVILATAPINGEATTQTAFGFYAKTLTDLSTSPSFLEELGRSSSLVTTQWRMDQQTYRADIVLKATQAKDVVDLSGAPRYSELWKDQKLNGIVVTGVNLRSHSAQVLDEYLAYFQAQGFKFNPEKKSIPDLAAYLREKIQTGDTDYLIKEAHSDGDDKNLLRIEKKALLLEGHLQRPDGKVESISLIFPAEATENTELISNQDFGDWVRERSRKNGGQLVYFNTSCWSAQQAANQILAAQTRKFLTIAATTTVNIFDHDANTAESILLTSFREGKNYDQMREALKRDPDFKSGKGNHFIFPDESDYRKRIIEPISNTVDAKVTLTDQQGRPYSMDLIH